MDTMAEAYAKSQRRIQLAKRGQAEVEPNSTSWKEYQRIIDREVGAWN